MNGDRFVLAGGSGFLGRTLAKWFLKHGHEIVVLSRSPDRCDFARAVHWDARTLDAWCEELQDATAVINLAGRSVNCRYHARNRKLMMDSRVDSTHILGEAITRCEKPPPVWLNSSTATIYKHTYGLAHDEHGEIGATPEAKDAYSIEIATAWERAFTESAVPDSIRKIALRTAMVFGNEPGGAYEVLRRLIRFGLGGRMAHGRQYVSWIHEADFCRAIEWLIDRNDATGIYNLAAPDPLTNAEMMATFRRVFRRPIGLPATRWMLEVGAFFLRTETELMIKSRRVAPTRLMREGFVFTYPEMESAVRALEGEFDA